MGESYFSAAKAESRLQGKRRKLDKDERVGAHHQKAMRSAGRARQAAELMELLRQKMELETK